MTADDQECWPLAGAVVLALLVIIVLKANDMVPEGTITVASHAILVMLAAIIIYKAIAILRGARQAINRPVNVAQLASPADDDPQQGHDPSLAPLLGRRSHET
ncbi:hypothetical protein PBRA_008934 [Plasmodiophora brassicae]|nr:hypothetical protein PBRA_008934 [Plasmodiophora brassicae]